MNFFRQLFGGSSAVDLESLIKEGAFIVDVRTPGEYAGGHAKGAVNIPLDQLPKQLAKFKHKQNIIVCCQSGGRSGQAKTIFEKNGFGNVTNGGSWNNVAQYC
ncbi:rhodanese-like domain-containing protein [Mucilaginibacter psychrotolerans]|uniref:Rhodanese-like domain-containing protein n=1 Tax=Mucilaginibacter psychrotolerans TaxID=1524096 RepID=A0A4Y8SEV3_9SPHI|nr:rhodanese-like domain-containing protein [Mucilaginibacter psychrotolerans]TFF37077.1 rhodanese-like domain-containing protein [Mucilaginibacter psychrotolerans]